MKQNDLFRTDVDFKKLSNQIWEFTSKVEQDKKLLQKLFKLGKGDENSVYNHLGRLIVSILDGLWSNSEDLARQMDLNVTDHHKYLEIYGLLNGKKNE